MSINLSKVDSPHFCAAPWTNVHVNFTGHVKPCCHGSHEGYGSIQQGVWDYTNPDHPELIQLKQQLIAGVEPEYCQNCHERAWYSEFLNPDLIVEDVASFNLKSVDVRWGTTCQLSCTYCDQWNSSTWAQLEHRANRTIPIAGRAYKNKYTELFEFILTHREQIQRVNLLGGEPLLLNENQRLLESINPDTAVEIFTNLNVDLSDNTLYQQLIQRNRVVWRISMETTGKHFEFVRRGAAWERQVANLQRLSRDIHNTDSIMTTQSQYCVYSATRMTDLYDFVETVPGLSLNWSLMLHNPECLNFFLFPEQYKTQSLEQIEVLLSRVDNVVQLQNIQQQLLKRFHDVKTDIVEQAVQFHRIQEAKYFGNQFRFLDLWPEYSVN